MSFPFMTDWPKKIITVLFAIYAVWCLIHPADWHFIDTVNLFIHEGGHFVFMPFGMFLYILGGSLMQILMPFLFVIYFYYQQQYASSAVCLFWMGESVLNVAVYAGDAVRMQLSLLFGDDSIHDWNWLLIYTGQLHHTIGIAFAIKLIGLLLVTASIVWIMWATFYTDLERKVATQ